MIKRESMGTDKEMTGEQRKHPASGWTSHVWESLGKSME